MYDVDTILLIVKNLKTSESDKNNKIKKIDNEEKVKSPISPTMMENKTINKETKDSEEDNSPTPYQPSLHSSLSDPKIRHNVAVIVPDSQEEENLVVNKKKRKIEEEEVQTLKRKNSDEIQRETLQPRKILKEETESQLSDLISKYISPEKKKKKLEREPSITTFESLFLIKKDKKKT